MNLSNALNAAAEAAQLARPILRQYFGRVKTIDEKPGAGLVSEADRESEKIIQSTLQSRVPEAAFLGEESGAIGDQGDWVWVVDPLDGTHNFVSGFPVYGTSIALVKNGIPQVGLVEAPELGLTFTAIRGHGAFLNNERLKVTSKPMERTLLATGFSYQEGDELDRQAEVFRRFLHVSLGVRRPGAAALDLCWVASGAFGGFWERGLKAWDLAAGMLMIEEAGGVLSDYAGQSIGLHTDTVVAAAPHLHKEMLKLIDVKKMT